MSEQLSRLPDPSQSISEVMAIAGAMAEAIDNGSIPDSTVHLVQLRAGQLAGNTYHVIRQTGDLRKAGETEDRISAVASWRDAPYFTDAERVALELTEAALTHNPAGERVPGELFDRAAAFYDTKQLWTLVLAIAQISFFIPVAVIGKPTPGRLNGWRPGD